MTSLHPIRALTALLAVTLATACRTPPPDGSPSGSGTAALPVCRQPGGEFGAGGCAVVHGRVVDARGRPVHGTGLAGSVASRGGCMACNSPGIRIDSLGRFRQTVHWFDTSVPDSALATVHVAAIGPGYPVVGTRPAYMDSVNVVLRFARTGEPVKPSPELVLRLPIP